MSGGSLRYFDGAWRNGGTTDANGVVSFTPVNQAAANLTYEMTFNNGRKTQSTVLISTNPVIFQTISTSVRLASSGWVGLASGTIRFFQLSWQSFGTTDANGIATQELLPGTYTFEMTYNNGRQTKSSYNISATNALPVPFQTISTPVRLATAAGTNLAGGVVRFFQLSWQSFGTTDANGIATQELLPGTYTFEMTFNNGRKTISGYDIGAVNALPVLFQTTATSINLSNSTGSGLAGGSVRYFQLSWQNFGTTGADGNVSAELLPGSYSFEMTFNNGRLTKNNINVPEANTFQYQFKTVNASLRLENSQTVGLAGGVVRFFQLSWQSYGTTTANGNVANEILPGSYSFELTYNNGRQTQNSVAITDPLTGPVLFKTIATTVRLQDSQGSGLAGGVLRFFQLSWQNFGTTGANGNATNELLPGSYNFEMTYANGRQTRSNITIAPGSAQVTFSTVAVTVRLTNSGGTGLAAGVVRFFQLSWQSFGTTAADGRVVKELLPGTYTFEITYNGMKQTKSQDISTNSLVSFQTA